MILTDEGNIIYEPLITLFEVDIVGGSPTQRQNTMTNEYEPDRSLFPVALKPRLQVTDHNITEGQQTADRTSSLSVNWYTVSNDTETPITATTGNYAVSGKNLIISANVTAGSVVHLRLRAQFVNPNTNDVIHFVEDYTLSTETYIAFNPAVSINLPNYSVISPFKLTAGQQRVVTARLMAGGTDISTDTHARFLWEKMEAGAFRAITATDVEVASINGRTMVLNLECVGHVTYRLTGWHTDYAQERRSVVMTLHRQLSGYSVDMRIFSGKLLMTNITESAAEAIVRVNSNEINNPLDFFRFHWRFFRQPYRQAEGYNCLGYGVRAIAPRSLSGYDKTRIPTFQMEYQPLTEYQLLTDDNGDPITDDNDELVIGQLLVHDFET